MIFAVAALLAAALAAGFLLWQVDPAYALCAGIGLSVFAGNWHALGLPGFPFVPDRLAFALVVAMVVLRAPAARGRPRFVLRPEHLLLVLVVAYAVCSALIAGTIGRSTAIFALLDRLGVVPFGLFVLAPLVLHSARQRNLLLLLLLGLGTYLGLTALLEIAGPHALVFPRYIVNPNYGLHYGRARGPFVEAETDGFAMFACAIAAAIVLATWHERPRLRAWAALTLPLCLLGCLLSLERGVWLGVIAGGAAGMLTAPELRRWLPATAAVTALMVVGALAFVPGLSQHVTQRADDQVPVWDRQNQNAAAVRMIAARPLGGVGWNRFDETSTPYFVQADTYPLTGYGLVVHNIFLSNAVELGLLGATLWLVALLAGVGGAIARRAPPELRAWRRGLLALAVFWFVVALFNPLQQSFSELLLWTWAGLVSGAAGRAACAAAPGARPRSSSPPPRPR